MRRYSLSELFKFESRDISSYMMHNLRMREKFRDSFNYVTSKLPVQNLKKFKLLKWDKGKNYSWCVIKDEQTTLIVRAYRTHFTIFYKQEDIIDREETISSYYNKYGCFTFCSNFEKMTDDVNDDYVNDNYKDIDFYIKPLLKVIRDDDVSMLWNDAFFNRPDHLDIKIAWTGHDDLHSIENFIYCCEELFRKHCDMFAENEMVERIQTINVGDILDKSYVVTKVNKKVHNGGYYHGTGISLSNLNFPDSNPIWADVYSLTTYYLKYMFPETEIKKQE